MRQASDRLRYVKPDRFACFSKIFRYLGEVNHPDLRTWANGRPKPSEKWSWRVYFYFFVEMARHSRKTCERRRYKKPINFTRGSSVDSISCVTALPHFAYLFNVISFRFPRWKYTKRIYVWDSTLFDRKLEHSNPYRRNITWLSPRNYLSARKKAVTRGGICKTFWEG